jgi:hypothetical protein
MQSPHKLHGSADSGNFFQAKTGELKQVSLGDHCTLSCGHEGRIVWISRDGDTFAVKARTGAHSCCNRKTHNGLWNPTIYLTKTKRSQIVSSHLTTLVERFLRTLENVKDWNHLDNLVGEARLIQYLSNIIEYTFYYHKKWITPQEVETLVQILEKGGNKQ